ncbi:TolC family protein [Pseudorhodoferax sp.]|uniref:TolC family protein n=1 Tax=Pseudorhodoferax sp. TaxID=1993553 RepID=UPI002DD66939|nr:TolC family protein [Pseudorhodoferax sp.]
MLWKFSPRRATRRLGAAVLVLAAVPAWAQTPPVPATSLTEAFAQAWALQPEQAGTAARRDAGQAQREAAERWTPEPPALEAAFKSDRLSGNDGAREIEAGLAVPLWLPRERGLTQAQAHAEGQALESRLRAAQWRLAGQLREAWWALQLALLEQQAAATREDSASRLARDVARRVASGDLARADQNQADGALAQAQADTAEAGLAVVQARQALLALGVQPGLGTAMAEPLPALQAAAPDASHPALAELDDRARVAARAQDLAAVQKRANPELALLVTRERGAYGESNAHALSFGLRVPLGSASAHRAKVATASAERIEAEQQRLVQAQQLAADAAVARARLATAETVAAAAARRTTLALQTRGFFETSFRLGETDLPNRLRVELEAYEAERQSARARVAVQQAISALRQALGLLPQ